MIPSVVRPLERDQTMKTTFVANTQYPVVGDLYSLKDATVFPVDHKYIKFQMNTLCLVLSNEFIDKNRYRIDVLIEGQVVEMYWSNPVSRWQNFWNPL